MHSPRPALRRPTASIKARRVLRWPASIKARRVDQGQTAVL
ncbi:hypothetical protein [Phytohabitans rumicis]|nr:hypothetical protein [Phytohabitans rumicis]